MKQFYVVFALLLSFKMGDVLSESLQSLYSQENLHQGSPQDLPQNLQTLYTNQQQSPQSPPQNPPQTQSTFYSNPQQPPLNPQTSYPSQQQIQNQNQQFAAQRGTTAFRHNPRQIPWSLHIEPNNCQQILQYISQGNPLPIPYRCDCIIDDLKSKETENQKILDQATEMQNNLSAQVRKAKQELEKALQNKNNCPDTSALQNKCTQHNGFKFVKSEHGCGAICYHLLSNTMSFAGAVVECRKMGGYLAKLDNVVKNALIANEIRSVPTTKARYYWIGLRYVNNSPMWVDNTRAEFTDWANGEPDTTQNCVVLNPVRHHRWDDRKCTLTFYGICEIRA